MGNMDYVEKSKVMVPEFLKARKEKIPCKRKTEGNEMILQIKMESERPQFNEGVDNIEALLKADTAADEGVRKIKEEPLDQNVEVTRPAEKPAEKSEEDYPSNSHSFLAPTPPLESESESKSS